MSDFQDALHRVARPRGEVVGEALTADAVVASSVRGVRRGRRRRTAAQAGAGALGAAVIGMGAWLVLPLGGATDAMPAVTPSAAPGDLPVFEGSEVWSAGPMNGPQDGVEPPVSQEIQDRFACGAPWDLAAGYYPAPGYAGDVPGYEDSLDPGGDEPQWDVESGSLTWSSALSSVEEGFYDTAVLLWVRDGVIVGNARVQAGSVLVNDREASMIGRVPTARGATLSADLSTVSVELPPPGSCEKGETPGLIENRAYELHVVHEYGPMNAFTADGPLTSLDDHHDAQFRSGDPFTQVVDPAGGPWVVQVTGLTSDEGPPPAELEAPDGVMHQSFLVPRPVEGCAPLADLRADGLPTADMEGPAVEVPGVTESLGGEQWGAEPVLMVPAGDEPWFLERDAWLVADIVSAGIEDPHLEWTSLSSTDAWMLAAGGEDPVRDPECAYVLPIPEVLGAVFLVVDGVAPEVAANWGDATVLPEEVQTWIYLGQAR